MDIYEVIRQDHETVRDILEKLEETSSRALKGREKDFNKLQQELLPHKSAEEALFYPKMMDNHREDILEAFEEHHVVDLILNEMRETPMDDPRWSAKLRVLKDMIEHHVEEEEGQVFDDAEDELSDDEAVDLAEEFQSKKKEFLASMPQMAAK